MADAFYTTYRVSNTICDFNVRLPMHYIKHVEDGGDFMGQADVKNIVTRVESEDKGFPYMPVVDSAMYNAVEVYRKKAQENRAAYPHVWAK